jgi:hypothetical protein
MSGWNPLAIGPFLSMEVLCGFSKMIEDVGIIGDWIGAFRKKWRILNEKVESGLDHKFRALRW